MNVSEHFKFHNVS